MARRFEIPERFCGHLVDSVSGAQFRLQHQQLHPEVKSELMSRMEVDIVRLIRSQADCQPDLQTAISEVVTTFDELLQSELEQNHAYCSLLQDIRRRRGRREARAATERRQWCSQPPVLPHASDKWQPTRAVYAMNPKYKDSNDKE